MGIGVKVKVWGDYALFSRPELKVERYSYDVMTPSAARGILEAIYWHPGLRWKIDRIYVNKPIRFTSVRRNEVKSKALASKVFEVYNGAEKPLYISTKQDIVQRASVILTDVFLSSSVVKEIASFGGDITGFVPKQIQSKITDRLYKPANNIDQ